jgi:hypothetical protein
VYGGEKVGHWSGGCEAEYREDEVVYEERFGMALWWCKVPECDGAGVGIDLIPEGAEDED